MAMCDILLFSKPHLQYNNGNSANPSVVSGYDKERKLDRITIDGLKINGKVIQDAAENNIQIGGFVQNIKFTKN
jgi:hypothetical protein